MLIFMSIANTSQCEQQPLEATPITPCFYRFQIIYLFRMRGVWLRHLCIDVLVCKKAAEQGTIPALAA